MLEQEYGIMTKKQDRTPAEAIAEAVSKNLRENYIKNMVQGYEVAMKMIVEFCDSGDRSVADIKAFCEQCLKPKAKAKLIKVAMRRENE